LKNPVLWILALASFVGIFVLRVPYPAIIGLAALAGYVGGRITPQLFQLGNAHTTASRARGGALIDDDTPTPPHALFRWPSLVRVLLIGVLLWVLPMTLLSASLGWHNTLTQMGWFFTKAALLTFGGAYAVLPYVYQGAVVQYTWLTPAQMIDGLALGETTPGPLIMVVAFVGFVGGYQSNELQLLFGASSTVLVGVLAATLVTWFTFLPSFLFILVGGPLVEATHNDLKFTTPLTAITAAVVGVICSLAAFFGYHVLWPEGLAGPFDWISAALAVAAAVALLRYKRTVIQVVCFSAVVGLVLKLA
jgi:chromate transporter